MTYVRVKGFKTFKDRNGKSRCYHRRTGMPIDLEKHKIDSASFFAECDRIVRLVNAGIDSKPGTLGLFITRYRGSAAFADLAMRTRKDYQHVFDYLRPIAGTPITSFTTPMIVHIRDKAERKKGRRFANYVRTVFSLLFTWGRERGYVRDNPAAGIRSLPKPKGTPDANRP